MLLNRTGGVVKKRVVLQVNNTAVRIRLVIFLSTLSFKICQATPAVVSQTAHRRSEQGKLDR
jgi:hypothetical protein